MGEVVQLRDFKRKEEKEADLVRLAKQVMGLVEGPWSQPYSAPDKDPA